MPMLYGVVRNPTEMSGEAIPNTAELECELRSLESKTTLVIYQVHQSFLYSIFGDHSKGAKLALKRGDYFFRVSVGCPTAMPDTFHRGISLFDTARRTRKATHKRAAKKTLSKMKKWAKDNPNVVHTLKILEAEQFALNGNKEKACLAYERSIALSARSGMLQDAALANERSGEYLLNEIKDEDKAVHYFGKAIGYYKD